MLDCLRRSAFRKLWRADVDVNRQRLERREAHTNPEEYRFSDDKSCFAYGHR